MSFFKKRAGAILVLAVVVVFGTLFAANRSLGEKVQEIDDLLYTKIYDSSAGYERPSVESQLKVRSNAAQSLVSVGSSYTGAATETAALREARGALLELLDRSAGAKSLYAANEALQTAFDSLNAKLEGETLTGNQPNILEDARKNMTGAAGQIEISGYNEAVREFDRKTLSQFPTNIIRKLAFVGEPELFE